MDNMKVGTARQIAIGLVVAVMGSMVWAGAAEAWWPFFRAKHKLKDCRADLSTCDGNLAICDDDLGTCESNLTQAETELGTCEGDLAECEAQAPAAVPKTGQTTSYGTRDDGEIQAGVAWPEPRFSNNTE